MEELNRPPGGVLPPEETTVLAVDDNPASLRLLETMLAQAKYRVVTAVNGRQALDILKADPDGIDIILLDRVMPEMDGIAFCRAVIGDPELRRTPIIMQTAAGRPQDIRQGIEAGAFYYLVKPLIAETLLSIVGAARRKVCSHRRRRHQFLQNQESMGLIRSMLCTFRTIEEAESLAVFMARLFPDPEHVIIGISELFHNAVEHGNLAICYEDKGVLLKENRLKEEIDRRLADPSYREREVTVLFARRPGQYRLEIADEGAGFNWRQYLQVDPSRATNNHGRGIAMANMMCFDQLIYNELGNQVTGVVFTENPCQESDLRLD